jgi:hypothetical protein
LAARRQNSENVELAAAIEPTQQGKRRSSTDLATLLKNVARPSEPLPALPAGGDVARARVVFQFEFRYGFNTFTRGAFLAICLLWNEPAMLRIHVSR